MDDSQGDLRARLARLSAAASKAAGPLDPPTAPNAKRAVVLKPVPVGLAFVAVLTVLVVLLVRTPISRSPGATGAGAASATSTSSTLGLTQDQAVQIARSHAASGFEKLLSAESGQLGKVISDQIDGSSPQRLVWVVRLEGLDVICEPGGPSCMPGRPGVDTVVLDYSTGAFLESVVSSGP